MVIRKHVDDNVVMTSSSSIEHTGRDDLENGQDTETIPLTPSKKEKTDNDDPYYLHEKSTLADESKRGDLGGNNSGSSTSTSTATTTTTSTSGTASHRAIMIFVFQIGNIIMWYWTNGMNGISMQSYAQLVDDPSRFTSGMLRFLSTMTLTGVVTCLQLLLGALIGRILLFLWNPSITWKYITATHSPPLSALHALGSIATNVGFMYGKASVIQVIKLLEPFETLILQQLLFREAKCSIGIFSAITVVIGAAMSLLNLQSTPPHPLSIFFAILSGLTLSSRNVLQRKHHSQKVPVTTEEKSSSLLPQSVPSTSHDGSSQPQSSVPTSPPPVTTSKIQLTKLEKSVVQFTQLSFFSGCWTGACSVVLYVLIQPYMVPCNFQVLLWHPLYNIFSMITLGFCSALTHSLLNAGKRVFAICMAMLWFQEGLDNPATLAGLVGVAVGGTWYTLETKRKDLPNRPEYDKLVRCVVGLIALFWFQSTFQ